MPVTDVSHDLENRTLTITAQFAAPVKRIWQDLCRPAPTGEGVGAAGLPRDGGGPRTRTGRTGHVLHDRSGR